jgi:hypothetical protein
MRDGTLWPKDALEFTVDAKCIEQVKQRLQRGCMWHESAATHAILLATLDPDSQADTRTLARLRSCSARPSAALDALPTGPTMALSLAAADTTSMLRFSLGSMTLPWLLWACHAPAGAACSPATRMRPRTMR